MRMSISSGTLVGFTNRIGIKDSLDSRENNTINKNFSKKAASTNQYLPREDPEESV